MENSVADIELAREGHTALLTDPSYGAPALTTPRPFAISSAAKVAVLLFAIVYLTTKDIKVAVVVFLAQLILSRLLK